MQRCSRYAILFAALLAAAGWASPALPDDSDDSIVLVAKRELRDRLYGATILLAKAVGGDRHVGFILNKPTPNTLGKLFPGHEPSQKVTDPVYLGGPFRPEVIFALVNRRDSPGGKSVQVARNLYLAVETQVVDRIIEAEPQQARFFSGMVVWQPGELNTEIKRGLWYLQDVRADLLLRKSDGLWEELVLRSERKANTI
jgi:putative transcriptional regulator